MYIEEPVQIPIAYSDSLLCSRCQGKAWTRHPRHSLRLGNQSWGRKITRKLQDCDPASLALVPLTRKADSSGCARWTTQRPGSDQSRVAHPVGDASNADLILISFSDTSNTSLLDLYVNNNTCACGHAIPSHSQSADHYPPYTRFTLPIRGSRQKSNQ